MSLICHRTGLKSRYLLSIVVGYFLGILLSFACLPLISICDHSSLLPVKKFDPLKVLNRHGRSISSDQTLVDYASKDYEPQILPLPSSTLKNTNKSSISSIRTTNNGQVARPRYIADELGIREKVAVIVFTSSERLNTFALFLNQTLQEHVNRMLFFIQGDAQNIPDGMQVLAVHDQRTALTPFYVIKYLVETKMVQLYDWFLLVPDNTFIRGFKLNEFLHHISINQDIYMGQAFDDVHAVYCFFGSGIIFSGTIIQQMFNVLDWCTKNAFSTDMTDNIGRCVLKASKSACVKTASNVEFLTYVNSRFEFDIDIDKLSKDEKFNRTLTVHPINDLETMLKLQTFFNQVEIDEMNEQIDQYQERISNLSCYSLNGCGNTPWPMGVPPPFQPPTRFDVLRWDYFNETHIFFKHDNKVVNPMEQIDYEDINEVIQYAVEQFQRKYSAKLKFHRLINGYRQFDPTRGTQYIIDLSLIDDHQNQLIKRAELMRPLGLVEIIPMPFVTETRKLFLILPIHHDEQNLVKHFLHHANKTIFDREISGKFELLLTHLVHSKQEFSQSTKWFEPIRHEIELIRAQRAKLIVTYHTILLSSTPIARFAEPIAILDFFQQKLRSNALIFLSNPSVDIDSDFLNRCRLNVIENTQIFFPIAFYQYHPKIIGRTTHLPDPMTIDLHKSHGWFNAYAFDQIGLFMNDYVQLKKILSQMNISMINTNLYDLFIHSTDLHVLRAPDQSLRVHYRPIDCNQVKEMNPTEYQRCLMQQEKGLASRAQLAMIIIEEEQKKKQ